jgi:HAD superfamily hydrolase (TIGR01509 family)
VALQDCEGWIFDLDGTLTVAAHDFEAIRRELGLEPAKPILEQLARLPRDEASARYAQLDEIELQIAREARPAPGALALLQVLSSGGMRLGIVTRNSHRTSLLTLQSCGLEAFFKPCCIVGREGATPKPDPDGVHRLLAHWSLAPDRAVVVGDHRFDLLAGRAVGTATAHVDPTGEFGWPEDADVQVRGLDALRATLAAR